MPTDTKPQPRRPAANRKQLTFQEFGEQRVRKATSTLAWLLSVFLPVPLIAAGFALSTAIGPVMALAVYAGLVAVSWLIVAWRKLRSITPVSRIDWDTAPPYEQTVRAHLSPETDRAVQDALDRFQERGYQASLFRVTCTCGHGEASCTCQMRATAGAALFRGMGRAALLVGDHLLDGDTEMLRFVLAHECTHLTPSRSRITRLVMSAIVDGGMIVGILAPGMTVLPAGAVLVLVCLTARWAIEISCDIPAAHLHGAGAPPLWRLWSQVVARSRWALPWWQLPLRVLWRVLPAHPYVWLRARICRAAYARG
ncbi:hypothetical protein [Nonomuraea insulae]|uniref:Peptidase M48 domain-containing protein n=1 Tax=Nonomuraea insulae TaxID=1616787 RepID=A0ABW1D571_9ACTN